MWRIGRMGLLFIATSEENNARNREDYKKTSGYSEKRSAVKLKSARRRFGPDELWERYGYTADKVCPEKRSNQPEKQA